MLYASMPITGLFKQLHAAGCMDRDSTAKRRMFIRGYSRRLTLI